MKCHLRQCMLLGPSVGRSSLPALAQYAGVMAKHGPIMRRRLSAGDKEVPPILSAPELEARRWDGYRGMVAPQLLGSWNWPGASLQAGYETRMRAAIDAMLCRMPFWYSVGLH